MSGKVYERQTESGTLYETRTESGKLYERWKMSEMQDVQES